MFLQHSRGRDTYKTLFPAGSGWANHKGYKGLSGALTRKDMASHGVRVVLYAPMLAHTFMVLCLTTGADLVCALPHRYPYNLDFDFSALEGLQKFSINNLGDPFIESNYGVHSREFEVSQTPLLACISQLLVNATIVLCVL